MGNRRTYLVHQIVKYSRRIDQKGFTANHDGNITAKLDSTFLATPTAVSKGDIEADRVITLDAQGKKLEGLGNPFSEIKLHLAAYRTRSDIQAVVHAHPPFATARALVNLPLMPTLPEAIVSIGDIIPVAEFVMPGDPHGETIIEKMIEAADVLLLPGNGVLAVGDSVEQAYLRLELVEHLSQIEFYAKGMGTPMTLSAEQIHQLLKKRSSIGLGPKKAMDTAQLISDDELVQAVANRVVDKILKKK